MKSITAKAEIEAEIARLQSRLRRTETDPEFTPKELVRWDPSLIGTLLRIQHYKDIPANAFDQLYSHKLEPGKTQLKLQEHIKSSEWFGRSEKDFDLNRTLYSQAYEEPRMVGHGVLTAVGCQSHIGFEGPKHPHHPYKMIWESTDRFEDVAIYKRVFRNYTSYASPFASDYDKSGTFMPNGGTPNHASLPCSDYNLNIVKTLIESPEFSAPELHVPLADPDKSLLDQIFVVTSTKIPGVDKEVIVKHYPLSTLYKEWKEDKDAGRRLRKTPLTEARDMIVSLHRDLAELTEDRDATVEKRDRLINALRIATNMADRINAI